MISYVTASISRSPAAILEVRVAEAFVAVAEELHFGRAAARTDVPQPAISRHIFRLEAGLGVTLLKRTNRHVALTPEGRVFLGAERDVLAAARRAADAAHLAARGGVGQMRLGSAGTLPNDLAVRLMRAFRRDHSAVEPSLAGQLCELAGRGCRPRLRRRRARAGPVVAAHLEFEPLIQERRLLAVSSDHRLSGRGTVTLSGVDGEPIVSSLRRSQRLRDYWAGVDDGADPSYRVSALADAPEPGWEHRGREEA